MYVNSTNMKLQALGETLQKAMHNFQDVVKEMNDLSLSCDKYKNEIAEFQTKMESKCQSCEELNNKLQCKNGVMESVASALTRLNDTKNFNIITEIFNIICQENVMLTPPRDSPKNIEKAHIEMGTPKKDIESADVTMLNISVNESTSEIDGTPTTGRTSPIILSKKLKGKNAGESVLETGKKKCSNTWPTSETKMIKLLIPTPPGPGGRGGRKKLRQSRITVSRLKTTLTVDLTSSPELKTDEKQIKNEPLDVNDTILPSPTSGPLHLNFTNKKTNSTSNRSSPRKFKKPLELLRKKMGNKSSTSPSKCDPMQVDADVVKMENSISLLNNNRYKNSPSKLKLQENRIKSEMISQDDRENVQPAIDVDATRIDESLTLFQPPRDYKSTKYSQTFTENADDCKIHPDTNVSISILKQIEQLENDANRNVKQELCSPNKMPIEENTNFKKLPPLSDTEVSMSVIHGAPSDVAVTPQKTFQNQQRDRKRTPEKVETIYKEPTVRKKAEKRALPGWSCEECKNFYAELYKDNYEMLAKHMDECSKHRGKHNPTRPKTPENFWNPRWEVPDDTEAFNKRNNVS